jgi:tetratricopeptide (TPR) repeat protein
MGERQSVGLDGSRCTLLVPFLLFALTLIPVLRASAQETAASCSPGIGRITALQGNVEIQRAGQKDWAAVKKLDTTLCANDRLRTDAQSRALVSLQPETMVRVDQNTVIRLKQSEDAIEVEFFGVELAEGLRSAQARGAGYFITRFPKKFKVTTPHMNAAVEGTEFMVQVTPEATKLTVLEGKVSSQSVATGNTQLVEAGQSIASGTAGDGAIETVVKPQDAVQWVLRYPPISDQSDSSGISRVEKLLRAGSVEEALAAIDAELTANPSSSDAHALRCIIQVAKNDKAGALESATKATQSGAENYRTWLALSYAQQAAFELDAALESARMAASLRVNSSLAQARVAELLLSLGDSRAAEKAARRAIAADPTESHAHSILGFVHLAQVDTKSAQADFASAIDRDSFSSLPRLGLGLTKIRNGNLVAGRQGLEIAVALDPSNSLLRSYVGKAYYEENTHARDELASIQLQAASELDPLDPTPRLYQAIRLQTRNQPVSALQEIRTSIELNGNRAVYRSALKLDEDLAVRSASQGRIYRDLGFEDLAVLEGVASIDHDPGDFSGHRLLADTYSSLSRHEIARVNELFTSQVLQPLNLTPVPPQLGETNLFILDVAGPADIAFNEFSPVFNRDGFATHVSGTVGGNDTWGDDVAISRIQGRWSMSVGQFHFESDGFRANNDLEQDTYNAYLQFRQSDQTSIMTELRATRREQGDLRLLFDPDNFNPSIRQDEDTESIRLGAHHEIGRQSEWLASFVYQNAEFGTELPTVFETNGDVDTYSGEFQYIHGWERVRVVGGLRQTHRDQSEVEDQSGDVMNRTFDFDSTSGYAYSYWQANEAIDITAGVSADWVEGRAVDTNELNPKFGLSWQLGPASRIRLGAFRTIQPDSFSRQDIQPRLDPTQVVGFNQVFSGAQGETEWRYAAAVDHDFSRSLFFGAEVSRRELQIPFVVLGPPDFVTIAHATEDSGRIRLYCTPSASTAVGVSYRYDKRENKAEAVFPEGVEELRTHRVSASAKYFHPSGFSLDAIATYVDQQGQFLEFLPVPPFVSSVADGDRFWVLDTAIRYRLPRRAGILSITAENLTDERFRFQDVDPESPEILPERFISMKFTIAF